MKSVPRLLPLIAVAIGGVLALKTLSGVQALPDLLDSAHARAEEAPAKSGRRPASAQAAQAPLPSALPSAFQSRPPAPVCAQSPTELAKEAGLSPGELQTLQNLGSRRGQLDDRERALDTQLQLLAAAETKVDAKMKALNALKGQIQGLLGQASQQQQSDVDRLTAVYQKMKPRDAAAVMATLDDKVRVPVAAKMKDAALAAILSQMPTSEAKKLTESLAHRFSPQLSQIADPTAQASALATNTQSAGARAANDQAAGVQSASASDLSEPTPSKADAAAAPKSAPKPRLAARKPASHKPAVAHPRTDTPTVAAVKAAGASPAAISSPRVQTASSAAGAPKPPAAPSPLPAQGPPKPVASPG